MTIEEILEELQHLTEDELRTINRAACDLIKNACGAKGAVLKAQLKVGDSVRSPGDKTKYLGVGAIHKLNRTRAQVDFGTGAIWNIPYSMLEKAEKALKD